MIIELKQIFDVLDDSIEFEYNMDMSDYELFSTHPFITPVHVKGGVLNRAGIVTLRYTTDFTLKLICDRCLDEFTKEFKYSNEQILVVSLSTDNDEYIVVENHRLDMDELCLSDILLNLPSKLLCSRDCKGLCPKCGVNKNKTECLCTDKEVDPRLAVLSELLK